MWEQITDANLRSRLKKLQDFKFVQKFYKTNRHASECKRDIGVPRFLSNSYFAVI